MALKEIQTIKVEVGEHTATVEDGEASIKVPAPLETEAQIKTYIRFLQKVLEAMRRTK